MPSSDHFHFIKAFLKSPLNIGAIAPSSRALSRAMLKGLDLQTGQSIVEFGPGTGPITEQIDQVLNDPTDYLGIELNRTFVDRLNQRFPQMKFAHGSAEKALSLLDDHMLDRDAVAAVISGLPFASLPASIQEGVIDSLDQLMMPGTHFRTFQYLHAWLLPSAVAFRRRMAERFGPVTVSRPIMGNLPPALVLSWCR